MKKLLAIMVLLATLILMGCSDDDKKTVDEFDVMVTALEADNGGYINNMGSWILGVGQLNPSFDYTQYTVFDLRSADAFNAMHIDGAVNVTLSNMFDAAASATKPILVTCYSGHTASYAHALLRIKGYEAYVMKFGMSSYDQTLDKWTGKCSDQFAADMVKTASPTLPSFDYPELDTGFDTADEILDARIDAAVAGWGSALISATDAIANKATYNIINYWPEADYTGHGHIDGSFQVTPGTLTRDANLSVFDPAGNNIIYCYTGQTGAATAAYLIVLGYDVKDISFGFNNMNWTELPGHKWPKPFNN